MYHQILQRGRFAFRTLHNDRVRCGSRINIIIYALRYTHFFFIALIKSKRAEISSFVSPDKSISC